ncbi:AI-2E family transporter [Tahibacter soli]|uniref:AI-2E family transporter n=1 Tax=Tahibacter soli TaxID=2983605 RepID=A0A9X3YRQ5_9GAMM|nr:AI-2E family transporter [Tahibacter soli]MDC8015106.1 AI-2E family transporter [Tahibacter soli]
MSPRWWQATHWRLVDAEPDVPGDATQVTRRQQRQLASVRLILVWLCVLATFAALYLAKTVVVPVLFAGLVALSLNPIVAGLSRRWFPRALVAALVMIAGLSILALLVVWIAEPAQHWMERAPEAVRALAPKMRAVTQQIEAAGRATQTMIGARNATTPATPVLFDVWETVGAAPRLVLALFTVVLLVYFFLVYGESMLARAVEIAPSDEHKANAVDIARTIQRDMSRYLATAALINGAVGVGAGTIAYASGIGDPLLWGVLAAVLNFIPYVGPMSMTVLFVLIGLVTYANVGAAFVPAGLFALLAVIEGQFLSPLVLGRRLELNPVVILVWLIVLGGLWGAIGIVVAVPVLVALKIICQRVAGWRWFAQLVG